MRFFTDKDKTFMVVQVASANTFISSVTDTVKRYILKAFPKKYFRSIYIDTEQPFVEWNKSQAYNNNLAKKPYPNITLSPEVSLDDPIGGMTKNFLISSPNQWLPREMREIYPMLLEDPDDKFRLYYSKDYITMKIRFTVKVNTFLQNAQVAYWLKSRFDDHMFKYIDGQLINTEIPPVLINTIARVNGFFSGQQTAQENQDDLVKFENYLLSSGKAFGKIHQTRSMSDGKIGFFFGDYENILSLFDELNMSDAVIRDNSTEGDYSITFSVQASCWHPNAFILAVDNAIFKKNQYAIVQDDSSSNAEASNTGLYSTSLFSNFMLDRKDTITFTAPDNSEKIGQSVMHEVYSFPQNSEVTTVNFGLLLQPDLLKVLNFVKTSENGDIRRLLYVQARGINSSDGAAEGTVNYDTLSIKFDDPLTSDLVIDVYADISQVNMEYDTMMGDYFFRKPQAIGTLTIGAIVSTSVDDSGESNYTVKGNKVCIYKLLDSNDMDLNHSLRIMTTSGIGYIGLVPEGSPKATTMKIMLGKNKFGVNIIRCFERY